MQERDAPSLPAFPPAFSRGQGQRDSSLLVRKPPVSAAVLSFGISPRIKLTGTTFPGTPLCPQPSLWGKSQRRQHSVSGSYLIPKSQDGMGIGNWDR